MKEHHMVPEAAILKWAASPLNVYMIKHTVCYQRYSKDHCTQKNLLAANMTYSIGMSKMASICHGGGIMTRAKLPL